MERDMMKELICWKDNPDRKPLLLTGVRQCGKTYVMKAFGKTYFEDMAYFNFESDEGLQSIFDYDLKTDRILQELETLFFGKRIVPGKTLVIFDEIQACPRAITSLKYFCEEKRSFHIICAGSLLGVALKQENISFPVGKVDRLQMYPMSFSEFLRADERHLYEGIKRQPAEAPLPAAYTEPLARLQKLYFVIGGMPEAVAAWIEDHDLERVERIQDNILLDYRSDFAKHAPVRDVPKLTWVWDAIPAQLAKDNHKFIFSHVKKGARAKDLEDALQWLVDAGLVYRLELVEKPELPLSFCADKTNFKVYLADTGLLRRKAGLSARSILKEAEQYDRFKGALTENYVMGELMATGKQPYFWKSGNTAELDFLMEDNDRIIPIEAKSQINTKAKSFRFFCGRYRPQTGFRFSMRNIGQHQVEQTCTYSLPLYLIWRIDTYLKLAPAKEGTEADTAQLRENGVPPYHCRGAMTYGENRLQIKRQLQEHLERVQFYMEKLGAGQHAQAAFEELVEQLGQEDSCEKRN